MALKLILGDAQPEAVARILREARGTGRLVHPNMVPAHDLGVLPGRDGGPAQHYYTMKRIHGVDMAQVIRGIGAGRHEGGWNRRRLVEALRDVCQAIVYAHSKGVI
ncbi:MAG: hypothetical protein HY722_17375 [Planctomycetes bacterium]|nr:hypothetical protein [Planctomycetota bacterium]